MIFCIKCGNQLPDGAAFCSRCGTATGAAGGGAAPAAAPKPSQPTIAAAGAQELKCPSCGAPIHPVFGDAVISCEYCGGSVTLGGDGWKQISKHTMLALKVTDRDQVLKTVEQFVDTGFFHRHDYEQSKISDEKLSYVPFWIIPVSASTTYQYQAVAQSVGATLGTMAAGELLGSALGGRRGGMTVIPIVAAPVVNPTRSESFSQQYEYPIIAVKGMTNYQPHNYTFGLDSRSLFDRKQVPSTATLLNGDVGEDQASQTAQARVQQLQSEAAHKRHPVVSNIQTKADVSDGELLHVPLWTFTLERKGARNLVVVDANLGRVIQTI